MKTEPKPCPFCGQEPILVEINERMGFAVCTTCKCRTTIFSTAENKAWYEKAIKAWNRRTEVTDNGKVGMDIK